MNSASIPYHSFPPTDAPTLEANVEGQDEVQNEPTQGFAPQPWSAWTVVRVIYGVLPMTIMIVLVRVWGRIMPSHSYFYCVAWAIGFIPCFAIFLLIVRKGYKQPPVVLDHPWPMIKQSLLVSFLFALNYLGVSTAAPYVKGPMQVVLTQSPIVLAAILSALVFSRRYPPAAWMGILLVVAGTVIAMVGPGLTGSASDIGWCFMFLLGNLPTAFFAVVLEGFHKARSPVDNQPNTMELRMIWTNVFLMGWLLVLAPVFGVLNQPPLAEFWHDFRSATECVFTGTGGLPGDDCSRAGWILAITIPVAALQAHSQIVISRAESGLFANLALTVAPFLSDAIFPIAAIMGPFVEHISGWDGVGAILCCVGIIVYSVKEYQNRDAFARVEDSKFVQMFMSLTPPKCLARFFSQPEMLP